MWFQAAVKPVPKGATVNELIESAFMKLARLEAEASTGDEQEAEAVVPPPAPTGSRPGAESGGRSRRNTPRSKRCRSCFGDFLGRFPESDSDPDSVFYKTVRNPIDTTKYLNVKMLTKQFLIK